MTSAVRPFGNESTILIILKAKALVLFFISSGFIFYCLFFSFLGFNPHSAIRNPQSYLLRAAKPPRHRLLVVPQFVQTLTVSNGKVEDTDAAFPRFPRKGGLANTNLPAFPGEPDRLHCPSGKDGPDGNGFIDLNGHTASIVNIRSLVKAREGTSLLMKATGIQNIIGDMLTKQ